MAQKPEPPPKKEPKTTQASKATKTEGPKGKQKYSRDCEVPTDNRIEEKDNNVIYCEDNTREWCHVEYSLLKDVLPTTEINVIAWGEAAKIVTKEDCRSVKTAVINDKVWVYFEIIHKINKFNNEDVVRFKESKITFMFSQDNKKMMPAVANDWPRKFVFCNNSVDNDEYAKKWFLELYQIDPTDEKFTDATHKSDSYRISRPDINSVVTMLSVKQCEKSIESKLHSITSTLPVVEQPLEVPKTLKGKKTSDIKAKKDNKGKGDSGQEVASQLLVDAQLLIAGKYNACAEQKEISEALRYAAVFVNSSKVLTDEQDVTFVPLIVNIRAFEALPLQNLQQLKVNKVLARYELSGVLDEIETQRCSLQENIELDDTRVFFLSSAEEAWNDETLMMRPSMMALAEALLSRRFVVKIYGEKDIEEEDVPPCIFCDRPTDPFISTPGHEMFLNYRPISYSSEIFLGSACFNFIHLIKGYKVVEAYSVLTSSTLSSWDPTRDFTDILDSSENKEQREALMSNLLKPGPIPESVFIEHNTRVTLKVSTTCQLTTPEDHHLLNIRDVSHRAILVFKGQSFNNQIVGIIEKSNKNLLDHFSDSTFSQHGVGFVRQASSSSHLSLLSTRLSDCFKLNLTLKELKRKINQPTTITGFFVEHEEESILVFEAMTYVIPSLITQFQSMGVKEDCVRIICDSSIFFTKRLYMDLSLRNIFRIKLAQSLNDLLKQPLFYTKQSMLKESLQTLLLLDLLRRCRTLNSACVNQLFPSCKQLYSFSKMFSTKENLDNTLNGSCKTQIDCEANSEITEVKSCLF